ncbi:MAG: alanine--tRNA ligase, partial [Thermoguttaceae bacterium]
DTNYHIDTLRPLVEAAAESLHLKYDPKSDQGRRLRRIADHIRACTFAVHENVYPGNKEEKYVIRRLLRRAVLDGRQMGCSGPFLHLLVPKVAEIMQLPYPELSETTGHVAKIIKSEEEHFIGTVDSGLERIERIFDEMKKKNRSQVSGADAFDMYQTFGFPPELFETMAEEHHLKFDWSGFRSEMERHGELSGSGEKNLLFKHDPFELIKKTHRSEFRGYDQLRLESAKVVAILADGNLIDQTSDINHDIPIKVVLDNTPFYGEKGGQVGDCGVLSSCSMSEGSPKDAQSGSFRFEVESTQMDGDLIAHVGHLRNGILKVGDFVTAQVDVANRLGIARAHSATHLLHHVLRKNLGGHAEQQGSKVDNDVLRFDFTNHQSIDKETLLKIEKDVNELIIAGSEVLCDEMSLEDARKTGAMMLFGEKYPEKVRVVQIGESKELCGGTHLSHSTQIGLFKIVSEESVSAGTRRITAMTGKKSMEKVLAESVLLQLAASQLKIPAEDIPARIETMVDQIKKLQKQLKSASSAGVSGKASADELIENACTVTTKWGETIKVITAEIPGSEIDSLRALVDQIRQKTERVAMMFAATSEDKVTLVAGLSRDIIAQKISAVDWIRAVVPAIDGKGGGGRPDLAQAGGKSTSKLPEAFSIAKKWWE